MSSDTGAAVNASDLVHRLPVTHQPERPSEDVEMEDAANQVDHERPQFKSPEKSGNADGNDASDVTSMIPSKRSPEGNLVFSQAPHIDTKQTSTTGGTPDESIESLQGLTPGHTSVLSSVEQITSSSAQLARSENTESRISPGHLKLGALASPGDEEPKEPPNDDVASTNSLAKAVSRPISRTGSLSSHANGESPAAVGKSTGSAARVYLKEQVNDYLLDGMRWLASARPDNGLQALGQYLQSADQWRKEAANERKDHTEFNKYWLQYQSWKGRSDGNSKSETEYRELALHR